MTRTLHTLLYAIFPLFTVCNDLDDTMHRLKDRYQRWVNASKMLFLTVLLLPIRYPIMFLYSMGCLPIIHMIIHSILYSIVSIICVGRKCANHLKDQEIYKARSLIFYVMFCRSLFVIVSCFL